VVRYSLAISTGMRSARLLSLLLLLQSRSRVTAAQAARELGVTERTIYRDVEALSTAGVPVYTERGRAGGIRLVPGYTTDVTGLTAQEARALVALTGQAVPGDLGMGTALAAAVHKLVAAVPASHRHAAQAARDRVLVDHTGWYRTPATESGAAETVQEAVWADRRIRIRYRHGDGSEHAYLLDPWGLVLKGGLWYLVAGHRGGPRLFRVDRILSAEVLQEATRRPSDLDLAATWSALREDIERAKDAVHVLLDARAEVAEMVRRMTASQRVGDVTTVACPDPAAMRTGWIRCAMTFRAPGAAAAVLLGFGAAVEVVSPEAVRDRMRATAAQVLAVYGADGRGGGRYGGRDDGRYGAPSSA